ncbi:MAG: hypothetical protein M9890_04850 [Thermomicrobiales bacterium]|nr:hypothetical protein [Thermomicrobiales bacterium]
MSTQAHALTRTDRPTSVRWAVIITIVGLIAGIPFYFAPGFDDVPIGATVFSIVATIVTLVVLRSLWDGRRWAAIAFFAITLLNALSSVPGLFDPPSGWVTAAIVVGLVFTAPVLVLIALPESRRSYH